MDPSQHFQDRLAVFPLYSPGQNRNRPQAPAARGSRIVQSHLPHNSQGAGAFVPRGQFPQHPSQQHYAQVAAHQLAASGYSQTRLNSEDPFHLLPVSFDEAYPAIALFDSESASDIALAQYTHGNSQYYQSQHIFNAPNASHSSPWVPHYHPPPSLASLPSVRQIQPRPTLPTVGLWPTRQSTHQHDQNAVIAPSLLSRMPDQTNADEEARQHTENPSTSSSRPPQSLNQPPLDAKSREKQEIYRKKGEARREAIKNRTPRKRKSLQRTQTSSPTEEPPTKIAKHITPAPSHPSFVHRHTLRYPEAIDLYFEHKAEESNNFKVLLDEQTHNDTHPMSPSFERGVFAPASFIAHDYEDYTYAVGLYELPTKGPFHFAQAFLEEVFTTQNLYSTDSPYKWHAHTSKGFIEHGDRLSFLVLHNAADPFEASRTIPSHSSTTIGVYGRYWHTTNEEIHWKTFSPSIMPLLRESFNKGLFTLKYKWTHDNRKATERRFHRAYWLAANLRPLGGLLNHQAQARVAHDLPDEDDEEVVRVTARDLQSKWQNKTVPKKEANAVWKKIQREAKETGDGEKEHVVTGCSEWDESVL